MATDCSAHAAEYAKAKRLETVAYNNRVAADLRVEAAEGTMVDYRDAEAAVIGCYMLTTVALLATAATLGASGPVAVATVAATAAATGLLASMEAAHDAAERNLPALRTDVTAKEAAEDDAVANLDAAEDALHDCQKQASAERRGAPAPRPPKPVAQLKAQRENAERAVQESKRNDPDVERRAREVEEARRQMNLDRDKVEDAMDELQDELDKLDEDDVAPDEVLDDPVNTPPVS